MSTNRFARPRTAAARLHSAPDLDLAFDPIVMRERADGWLPDRQVEFIEALAESGCVEEACARVGMSTASAYTLRRRPDAKQFRRAWEAAVAFAIRRLSDAATSRALRGVARPVFYKGEQIGERRYYDERLTQFLLRYNDPVRYGRWRDGMVHEQVESAPAAILTHAANLVDEEAWARVLPRPPMTDEQRRRALMTRADHAAEEDARFAAQEAMSWQEYLAAKSAANPAEGGQVGAT